jgi:hypothetical protein
LPHAAAGYPYERRHQTGQILDMSFLATIFFAVLIVTSVLTAALLIGAK